MDTGRPPHDRATRAWHDRARSTGTPCDPGGTGPQPGDDPGGTGPQPGDDPGGTGPQPGDDPGGSRPQPDAKRPAKARSATVRFAVLVVVLAGLAAIMIVIRPSRAELIHAMGHTPAFGPAVAVLGSAVLIAALAPRTLLAAVGGALFGTAAGSAYVVLGVTIGAVIAFAVGRVMGRDFVAARLGGRVALVEQAIQRHGAVAVLVSRLIPLVPFGVANYAFGTTGVRPGRFALGTLVGVVPATVAYAALGSAAMKGNGHAILLATGAVVALGTAGSIGTYLVWRRRPRHRVPAPDGVVPRDEEHRPEPATRPVR